MKRDADFEIASVRDALARSEELLEGWRSTTRRLERELMDGEERLLEAELRAERLEDALVSIRSGRTYKLMRIAWRLRRPFRKQEG